LSAESRCGKRGMREKNGPESPIGGKRVVRKERRGGDEKGTGKLG